MEQNETKETAKDHVISIFHSRTCSLDNNETRETARDHVISIF